MAVADHLFWKFGQYFEEDETLFREGEKSMEMYIVITGAVDIVKERNGHCEILASLGEGEFFGEMALLSGEKRSASALVHAGSRLLVVGKETFISLLNDSGEVSLMMLNKLVERLRETTDRLNEASRGLLNRNLVLYALLRGPLRWPEERGDLAAFSGLSDQDIDSAVDSMAGEGLLSLSEGELSAKSADLILDRFRAEAPDKACIIPDDHP